MWCRATLVCYIMHINEISYLFYFKLRLASHLAGGCSKYFGKCGIPDFFTLSLMYLTPLKIHWMSSLLYQLLIFRWYSRLIVVETYLRYQNLLHLLSLYLLLILIFLRGPSFSTFFGTFETAFSQSHFAITMSASWLSFYD